MARPMVNPTASDPYLARWDAVDDDVQSTDPDQAPVDLTPRVSSGAETLSLTLGATLDTSNTEWHLILWDPRWGTAADDRAVVGVMSAVTATTPNSRRVTLDDDAPPSGNDWFIHVPVQFDLTAWDLGVPGRRIVLAMADLAGSTLAYLIDMHTWRGNR